MIKKILVLLIISTILSITPTFAIEISGQNSLNSLNEKPSDIPTSITQNKTNETQKTLPSQYDLNEKNQTENSVNASENNNLLNTTNSLENETVTNTTNNTGNFNKTEILEAIGGTAATITVGTILISMAMFSEWVVGGSLITTVLLPIGGAALCVTISVIAVSGVLELYDVHNPVADLTIKAVETIQSTAEKFWHWLF